MQLLYKATACKKLDGKQYLFPGYLMPRSNGMIEWKLGDKIKIERPDGTFAETTVKGIKPCIFDLNLMEKLQLRIESGFYYAIEVPNDFNETGDVYLIDSKG